MIRATGLGTVGLLLALTAQCFAQSEPAALLARYCADCHDAATQEAGLDLAALPVDFAQPEPQRRWVKVHDRLAAGEMPPPGAAQPSAEERTALVAWLHDGLVAAERAAEEGPGRTDFRRLTRAEYENTIRDLLSLPGIVLQNDLPADGSAFGFDKTREALDISHVNLSRYLAAADHALRMAVATRPVPPRAVRQRISLANPAGFVAHVTLFGDGILLKNRQPDPDYPPPGVTHHLDQGAHERMGSYRNGASVGLFRHEDESFHPYFNEFVAIYPAHYRVRMSLWSFQWDKGQVLPARGTEAARLSIVQLTGDGRGGGHPSTVYGYFDAPSLAETVHETVLWLNPRETLGFNAASLVSGHTRGENFVLGFTGPGIACDYVEVEGPFYESWPPPSHVRLFGDLPLAEFTPTAEAAPRPPAREPEVQALFMGHNRPDPVPGVWTVVAADPPADARRLLAEFLPRAFRRPVEEAVLQAYVGVVLARLQAGDCFETAMRRAYRAALCSPDFLYHVEPAGPLDDYALASRLSYFLWNSLPDERLLALAAVGELRKPEMLAAEVERLLLHPRAQRFINDFLGQWLKLRQIAANDPDKTLYPEFSPYLQDSMVAETRAYFRELLEQNLGAEHLVRSDFAMLNEKLAVHYGIPGVSGSQMRRVALPPDCPRGGFLTQAAILKVTANGTTTSPVPRGAFVLDRLLGQPPEPPSASVAAIEPDVRGATTIRAQLAKHREHAVCASCHARMDPPGFALESFDVIGGFRTRYRSIGEGDPAERGAIDPFVPLGFRLGPVVDPSGELLDGRTFQNIQEYQALLAADARRLLRNLAQQLTVYATGLPVRFCDRPALEEVVQRTLSAGGGLRTLVHEVVRSPLFTGGPLSAWTAPAVPPPIPKAVDESAVQRGWTTSARQVVPQTEPARAPATDEDAARWPALEFRVVGLCTRERIAALHTAFREVREAVLRDVDFDRGMATLGCDLTSELLRGANPEQIAQRLDERLRYASGHTLGLKPPSTLPPEQLVRVEIPVLGLDCQACCLAAYEALLRIEGVELAWADLGAGRAAAWIDPARVDVAKLRAALEQIGLKFPAE